MATRRGIDKDNDKDKDKDWRITNPFALHNVVHDKFLALLHFFAFCIVTSRPSGKNN
jgi:hypothetical protein